MFCHFLVTLLYFTCSSASNSNIAVVDLRKFLLGNESQETEVVNEVRAALEGVGLVLFKNHGIPQNIIDSAFKMQRSFFNESLQYKENYNKVLNEDGSHNEFFGYTGIQKETIYGKYPGYKEVYDFQLDGLLNHFEMKDEINGFPYQTVPIRQLTELTLAMRSQTITMLQIISLALDGPRFYLSNLVDQSQNGILRFVHYPPTPIQNDTFQSVALTPHTDFYPMVLGFQDSNNYNHGNGFEGWDKLNKKWVEIPYIPGTMLMNLGDCMQRWSNGRFIANFHRLRSVDQDRYAMYLFIGPEWNHIVDPRDFVIENETNINFEPATMLEIVGKRMQALTKMGENGLVETQVLGDPHVYKTEL